MSMPQLSGGHFKQNLILVSGGIYADLCRCGENVGKNAHLVHIGTKNPLKIKDLKGICGTQTRDRTEMDCSTGV